MKNNKYYYQRTFSVLILSLLVLSLFSNIGLGLTIEKEETNFENNEFIVELVDTPVFQFNNNLRKSSRNILSIKAKTKNYKETILEKQDIVKNSILSLFEDADQENIVFSDSFYGLSNGFCIKNVPENIINKIRELPFVKSVFPNYKFTACLDESVPKINADDVWSLRDKTATSIRGEGVSIAVIDSGVDYTHPDLVSSYAGGYDFYNDDDDPMDDFGHGTHCAGILVGDGINSEYKGVAPDAELYAYKVLDNSGSGSWSKVDVAVDKAIDPNGDGDTSDHVDIISFSLGAGPNPSQGYYPSPDDAISKKFDEVVDLGVVVIASAGNEGPNEGTILSPGCALKVITVGCTDNNDDIQYQSSRGPVYSNDIEYIKPDVVAPGVGIMSAKLGGNYISMSGTSMSTPHVAGAAALLLQAHPDWTPAMVKEALEDTAVDLGVAGKDNTYGSGRIDVLSAINLSSAPPIAKLTVSNQLPHALVDITGTARSGTSNSEDFVNYSVFYQKDAGWIKIFDGDDEVSNGVLGQWNTSNLEDGDYKLKLFVASKDQANVDILNIEIGSDDEEGIFISAPSEVQRKTRFKVNITDINGDPVKAFVLLWAPFTIPRIKYGSTVQFRAPIVVNPLTGKLKGKIFAYKLIENKLAKQEIQIVTE